jgi:hypothetical protein
MSPSPPVKVMEREARACGADDIAFAEQQAMRQPRPAVETPAEVEAGRSIGRVRPRSSGQCPATRPQARWREGLCLAPPGNMDLPKTRTCAAMDAHAYYALTDETYRSNRRAIESFTLSGRIAERTAVARIPVVVHVLYATDVQNVSDAQVRSQIDALNRDYRLRNEDLARAPEPFAPLAHDALIEFGLATRDPSGQPTNGITRTRTSRSEFIGNTAALDEAIKVSATGHPAWPRDQYLNLWVCNLGAQLLGYAQFPGGKASTDGVVIHSGAFGTMGTAKAPFHLGRTATHEIGHWLNLLHIWGDDGGGCSASDNVTDTPNQANSNSGKPTFPCVSCGNAPDGDMFMNYMDYVDDDTMVMFSRGQVQRIDATLAGPRASLLSSPALSRVTGGVTFGDGAADRVAPVAPSAGVGRGRIFDGVEWITPAP